jgi:hypothetical protein
VGMAISAERSPFEPFSLPKVVNQVVNQGVQLVNRRSHPPESCESMAKSDREKTAKLGGAVTPWVSFGRDSRFTVGARNAINSQHLA